MNSTDTIKTIARLVSNYFRGGWNSEDAMDAIGRVLQENRGGESATSGRELKKGHPGFRVIDPEGVAHEYPNAAGLQVIRGDLHLIAEDCTAIVIFHRWEYVEEIAA